MHPSFLPYGRGKHSNVWAIINNEPFGATISSLGFQIDNGGVYCQKKIRVKFNSTAESLYNNAIKLCYELLKKIIKKYLMGN